MADTKALVILGNGFDVAWGIPTRYLQFYAHSSELKKYAAEGNQLCKHILDNKQGELWSDLEEGLYEYSRAITDKYGENNVEQASW